MPLVVPFSTTFAPITGSPWASFTTPVIFTFFVCWLAIGKSSFFVSRRTIIWRLLIIYSISVPLNNLSNIISTDWSRTSRLTFLCKSMLEPWYTKINSLFFSMYSNTSSTVRSFIWMLSIVRCAYREDAYIADPPKLTRHKAKPRLLRKWFDSRQKSSFFFIPL